MTTPLKFQSFSIPSANSLVSDETSEIRPKFSPPDGRPRVDGKGRWNRAEPMDQRHESQKRRLLDAAATLLDEAGLAALSVEQVTETAQVGRRTFYVHFEGRAQLLLALHEELAQPLFAALHAAKGAERTPVAIVHRAVEDLLRYVLQSPLRAQYILVDGPRMGDKHSKITQQYFDDLASTLSFESGLSAHEATVLVLGARGAALTLAESGRSAELPVLSRDFKTLLGRVLKSA